MHPPARYQMTLRPNWRKASSVNNMDPPDQMPAFYICHHNPERFHASADAIGLAQHSGVSFN